MQNRISALNKLLPFVSIGTIADAQSVLEPCNRLLIKAGIKVINNSNTYYGLESLIQELGLREKMSSGYQIDSQDMAFLFSPILNASGRISHANISINTLVQNSLNKKTNLAKDLIQINTDRKNIVKEYTASLDAEVKKQMDSQNKMIWLVGDWNKGVVGLIASRIQNQVNLPVAVISIGQENLSGSFRAPNGYNLPSALEECKDLLIKFGGHPQAAGFTFLQQNLDELKIRLDKYFSNSDSFNLVSDPNQARKLNLNVLEINAELLEELLLLDPFGIDFPTPIICIDQKEVINLQKQEMSLGKHFKLSLNNIDLIFFNLSQEQKDDILNSKNKSLILEFNIGKNYWKGKKSYQLIYQKYSES
jgi:single-stranded-DNA-specific exonuclease